MTPRIEVAYYDDTHKAQIDAGPLRAQAKRLVAKGLQVTEEEFLAYAMFTEWKDQPGWRTFAELKAHLPSRVQELRDYFTFDPTIHPKFKPTDTNKHLVERVGVAGALQVMGELLGVTEADWDKIPETTTNKTLDFARRAAANSNLIVEVEAKGAQVSSPTLKSEVSAKHTDIEKKKASQPAPKGVARFGVILAVSADPTTTARAWLLDPEGQSPDRAPMDVKLESRLRFYARNLALVVDGYLSVAVQNRIEVLRRLERPSVLDGVALVNRQGEPLRYTKMSFPMKARVRRHAIVGTVVPLLGGESGVAIFHGFQLDVFRVVAAQEFASIREFRASRRLLRDVVVTAPLRPSRDEESDELAPARRRPPKMQAFRGRLACLSSGRVFGFVKAEP